MAIGDIIVGVDIGTSKVCTLIGQVNKTNQIDVLGYGSAPCSGVRKGIIVDIESTAQAIRQAAEQAEQMAGLTVNSVYVNITGSNISMLRSKGMVDIPSNQSEINYTDIERVLKAVQDIEVTPDKKIIDIIPYQYIINGYDQIVDPIGMIGSTLEIDCQIVSGSMTSVQNLVRSVEKAGYYVDGIVPEAIAASEVMLIPDEKELGVLLLDTGAGITDISIFKGKRLIFYDSIPIGGEHITNDIAIGLKVPYNEADKIKKQYGIALTSLIQNDQEISIASINESKVRSIKISEVVEIIEARVSEIFTLVNEALEKAGVKEKISAGAVISGEGITIYDGSIQLGAEILQMPIRIGVTKGSSMVKPTYAVALGIVKYMSGVKHIKNIASNVKSTKKRRLKPNSTPMGNIWKKLGKIFNDFFV